MLSAEQERIPLDRPIDPKNKNVEDWMTELEEQMKLSVRTVLLNSITQYPQTKRQQWVLEHPGQCVLQGSQVHWTD
jgi:dynein heavy chain